MGRRFNYDPNTGSGDIMEMELGRGYWIHATADHDWAVDYVYWHYFIRPLFNFRSKTFMYVKYDNEGGLILGYGGL